MMNPLQLQRSQVDTLIYFHIINYIDCIRCIKRTVAICQKHSQFFMHDHHDHTISRSHPSCHKGSSAVFGYVRSWKAHWAPCLFRRHLHPQVTTRHHHTITFSQDACAHRDHGIRSTCKMLSKEWGGMPQACEHVWSPIHRSWSWNKMSRPKAAKCLS